MVGACAPATRPGSGRFAQRSAPRESPRRSALERVPPHHGPRRRPTEDPHTLNSHHRSRFSFSFPEFQLSAFFSTPQLLLVLGTWRWFTSFRYGPEFFLRL